ncbi:hypothetical protein Syun_018046 [Stephania yunnanensis]|uniref:Uncharacterized protein n=1 Tax=Stephania yunnanensis TaxID=152371 RepID=A0AAP0NVU9_9MAGN
MDGEIKRLGKRPVLQVNDRAALVQLFVQKCLEHFTKLTGGCVVEAPTIRQGEEACDFWTWKKWQNDMQRWIKKIDILNQLIKLLSRTPPLHQDDSLFCQLKAFYDSRKSGYQMSSLSVVLLVRVAIISLQSSLSASLSNSLNEVFEVLQFVDRKLGASSLENKKKFVLAEALWKKDNFNYLRPKIVKMFGNNDTFEKQSQLNQSIAIIKGLKEVSRSDYVQYELAMMTDFLSCGPMNRFKNCIAA